MYTNVLSIYDLLRRWRNKRYYALHGNPPDSLVFSAEAQLGIGILRARSYINSPRAAAAPRNGAAGDSDGGGSFHSAPEFGAPPDAADAATVGASAADEAIFNVSGEPRTI